MSLYNHLLASRTKEQLAKELAATAKELAAAKNRVHELEHDLFWMRVAERKEEPCASSENPPAR